MRKVVVTSLAICAAVLIGAPAQAQAPAPPPPPMYGEDINLELAKKAAAAAEAEIKKNNWRMAIAVVSPAGDLVHFSKVDGTQYASIAIAIHKAKAAATFRRPTKVFQDGLAAGNTFLLTLDGVIASEGGIPIIVGGKLVGAIGCSGGTGAQDGQACMAGINALK